MAKQRIDRLRSAEVKLKVGLMRIKKVIDRIASEEPLDLDLYYILRTEQEQMVMLLALAQSEMQKERETA